MADTDAELTYTEKAPLIVGTWDGKSKPKLYRADGYAPGVRLDQVGYFAGDGVKELVAQHVLVTVEDDATGVPPLQAALTQRIDTPNADLGFRNQVGSGNQVDTNALVGGEAAAYEPGGVTSITDEQSDVRPFERQRTVDFVDGDDPKPARGRPRQSARPARPAEAGKDSDKGDN